MCQLVLTFIDQTPESTVKTVDLIAGVMRFAIIIPGNIVASLTAHL